LTISEFSSFFNEHIMANIKVSENASWIDAFHITESNRTFRFAPKDYQSRELSEKIVHHRIDGDKYFSRDRYRLSRKKWPIRKVKTDAWENDRIQREFAIKKITPKNEDILIFSDIDEIINSKYSRDLIDLVNKHGIITVPLHYTLYFFNLFSANWYRPPNYSYRVFLMSGDYYKNKLDCGIDELRKRGERGDLIGKLFCFSEFAGFHHSWLGDEQLAMQKMLAYPHNFDEHDKRILDQNGNPSAKQLRSLLISGKSIYGDNHKLILKPEIELLGEVEIKRNDKNYAHLFL
jgi:hypothetical protein